jgi:hypothetical protein
VHLKKESIETNLQNQSTVDTKYLEIMRPK